MKSFLVGLACVLIPSLASAQNQPPRLARTCDLFAGPSASTKRLCRKRAGETISAMERAAAGFLKVRVADCEGFIPDACLGAVAVATSARGARRGPASSGSRIPYRIGLTGGIDGNFGKVPYASTLSSGMGYAAALRFDVPIASSYRLTFSAGYRALKMGREVDGTGAISDSNPAVYTQLMNSLSVQGVLGWFLLEEGGADLVGEIGGEFLKPLSASQTDGAGNTISFTATDKMALAVLGLALEYPLGESLALQGQVHGFYNLGASSGTGLFGARLAVSLGFAI